MAKDIKAPPFPESVADGTLSAWHAAPGEFVRRDALLAEIETDKVVLEICAESDGQLLEILKAEGEIILSDEVIGRFEEGAVAEGTDAGDSAKSSESSEKLPADTEQDPADAAQANPAARKAAEEMNVSLASVQGTGRGGRITKEDVLLAAQNNAASSDSIASEPVAASAAEVDALAPPAQGLSADRPERRVPMTRLRASIARRLVEAQQNAAMLTTFNEVDMTAVMALRKQYKALFEERHEGSKLGFMSFFVRASVEALKRFPSVNASIDGTDIVYHGYYDVGVAVSTDRGLVVPVIRDADGLSLAQIEDRIADYGAKSRSGKLGIEEMSGGTFTISNGGIFGSLLSTPILNPPQTGILGMHQIQQRPVVVDGEIVVRPMMYLALSYDHRMIDGQEAVRFLVSIKEMIEDPARILLEL